MQLPAIFEQRGAGIRDTGASERFSERALTRPHLSVAMFRLISIVDARYRQAAMLRMHYARSSAENAKDSARLPARYVSVARAREGCFAFLIN